MNMETPITKDISKHCCEPVKREEKRGKEWKMDFVFYVVVGVR
jgi:hypothetical protein